MNPEGKDSIMQVNLLFTTDVAEEGIDIPDCSCVIRFDLPRTVRSYVQSHGRARQASSLYVIMLERYKDAAYHPHCCYYSIFLF